MHLMERAGRVSDERLEMMSKAGAHLAPQVAPARCASTLMDYSARPRMSGPPVSNLAPEHILEAKR